MHRRPLFLAGLFYLSASAATTWPLVLKLGSHVNDLGDPLLNVWILAWNARTLPLTDAWWNMPQFFPISGVTAFSEHLLGLFPIATPLLLATDNPVLAYNVAFFLSFFLSALAGHALGWELTRRHDAALITGLAFAFAPYRASQLAHVQVLSSYWMPLALVGLTRFSSERRVRWLLLFAGSWLMQALTCGYYFFYLSVLIGLWLAWFAIGRQRWSDLARIAGVWAAAIAVIAPILYGYRRVQGSYAFKRWPEEIAAFSADVASLLEAPPNLWLWSWVEAFPRLEAELFPGVTIVAVIAAGAMVGKQALASDRSRLRATPALAVAAAVFLGVTATPFLFGAWKLEVAGVKLLSVATPHKPLSVAFGLLLAAAALTPTARALWMRRSAFAFFLLAALAMWLLALGPAPKLLNYSILYQSPYTWLMALPGVEGVRVPARFWMLAVLCLASAGALAFVRIADRWPRVRRGLTIAACVGLLADGWTRRPQLLELPERRPNRTSAAARLDLPSTDIEDPKALYRAIFHERPLINGYSGYAAPHYWALRYLLEQRDPEALTALTTLGDIEVIVNHESDPAHRWRTFVASHPAAHLAFTNDSYSSYRVRRTRDAEPKIEGPTVAIVSAAASINPELLPRMTDGDLVSRWDGRRGQAPGDSVTLDLGEARQVRGVELDIGGYVADFPRHLRIDTSVDAASWQEAWSGSGGRLALAGGLLDPRVLPLYCRFEPRRARYIRMTQLGSDPVYYWSVAEVKVFGT